jgi:uncharacterized protein (TIGR02118 family)
MTVVRFSTMVRKQGTSIEHLQEHWRTKHADAVRGLEGLGRYFQNHLVLEGGRPLLGWAPVDGCAEIEFEDMATMEAAFTSDHAREFVFPDSPFFLDTTRGGLAVTKRYVLRDGPPPEEGFKLLTVLRRHPACDQDAFLEALRGPYAEAVAAAEPLRHEQLVPMQEAHASGPPPVCDAVDLLWFEDASAAARFPSSPEAGRAATALAGRSLGAERLVAKPFRVN